MFIVLIIVSPILLDVINYCIVACIFASVGLFVHCNTTSHAHCHSHLLFLSHYVCGVADSNSWSFWWGFWLIHQISFQFHLGLDRSRDPYVWRCAVLLDRSKHWGQQLPFYVQVQWQYLQPSQFLLQFVLALLLSFVSWYPPLWHSQSLRLSAVFIAPDVGPIVCVVHTVCSLLFISGAFLVASVFFAHLLLNSNLVSFTVRPLLLCIAPERALLCNEHQQQP